MNNISPQRDFYEKQYRGHSYASHVELRGEMAALRAFLDEFHLADQPVLEVGCGRGAFKSLTANWIGVDFSFAAGKEIESRFIVATAESLPFSSNSFDGLWSITTLEHVPGIEQALVEIGRVLKPGGVAYLAPAWHCRSWAANGYEVRPYSALTLKEKIIKFSIPFRNSFLFRALMILPMRIIGELEVLFGKRMLPFRYTRLSPNYEVFWCSDSDACNSLDPHQMVIWFLSRGWQICSHPTFLSRFLSRHKPIIVRKPSDS